MMFPKFAVLGVLWFWIYQRLEIKTFTTLQKFQKKNCLVLQWIPLLSNTSFAWSFGMLWCNLIRIYRLLKCIDLTLMSDIVDFNKGSFSTIGLNASVSVYPSFKILWSWMILCDLIQIKKICQYINNGHFKLQQATLQSNINYRFLILYSFLHHGLCLWLGVFARSPLFIFGNQSYSHRKKKSLSVFLKWNRL